MKQIYRKCVINYLLNIPERFIKTCTASTIQIKYINGEYFYLPNKHTFLNDVKLTSEELKNISEKLNKLNKND